MARISSYPQDNLVEGTDKLIGTNEDGDVTKTYTLTSLGEWLKYNTQPIATLTSADGTQFIVAAANDGTIQGIPLDSVAPNITSLPVITGTLNVGETLTATPGTFTGIPEPTTVLQWQRSDDGLTGWADIAGAAGTTYLLGFNDEDKYIRVQQTEENILGTATANSVSTGQIQPAAFIGLLDEYPNAAGAYSLRKLRALYSGYAIRVTTNGTDSENIGFVNNELDTASLEAFANGGNAYVSTWYDQSGNGKDVSQSTFSKMPIIVLNGSTISDNLKPALDFQLATLVGTSGYSFTDFAAFSVLNSDTSIAYPVSCQTNNNTGWRQHITGNQAFRSRLFGVNIDTSNTPTLVQNLLGTLSYGTNGYTYVNGVLGASASVTPSQDINANFEIGGSESVNSTLLYDGRFQEVVVYDSDQSTNRTGIETNINNFYNIY